MQIVVAVDKYKKVVQDLMTSRIVEQKKEIENCDSS